jgi:hypothetical protein
MWQGRRATWRWRRAEAMEGLRTSRPVGATRNRETGWPLVVGNIAPERGVSRHEPDELSRSVRQIWGHLT